LVQQQKRSRVIGVPAQQTWLRDQLEAQAHRAVHHGIGSSPHAEQCLGMPGIGFTHHPVTRALRPLQRNDVFEAFLFQVFGKLAGPRLGERAIAAISDYVAARRRQSYDSRGVGAVHSDDRLLPGRPGRDKLLDTLAVAGH
jgi:hypothetical protein